MRPNQKATILAAAAEAAAQVPKSVTTAQARATLAGAGLLTQIDAAIAQADPAVQIAWEYATELHRESPTLLALAAALQLNDATLDALFIQAAQVRF
jgi:hypothetical protein